MPVWCTSLSVVPGCLRSCLINGVFRLTFKRDICQTIRSIQLHVAENRTRWQDESLIRGLRIARADAAALIAELQNYQILYITVNGAALSRLAIDVESILV